MSRVVCAGHVNWDVTLHVDALPDPDGEGTISHQLQAGGGSAANTALGLDGLGYEPVLLGSTGDDNYATLVEEELAGAGIDSTYLERAKGRETTVKYLVVDESGEVFVLANDGANEAFEAADLPQSELDAAAHLHLTSQHPPTALELTERGHEAGITVSFDPGRRLDERNYGSVIQAVDLLFVNEREAAAARDRELLARTDGKVVIKRGDGGATLLAESRQITHDGFDVAVSDTAGAGDAFAAGFLAATLDGSASEHALAVANACGAYAVQSAGARVSLSWDAIESYELG